MDDQLSKELAAVGLPIHGTIDLEKYFTIHTDVKPSVTALAPFMDAKIKSAGNNKLIIECRPSDDALASLKGKELKSAQFMASTIRCHLERRAEAVFRNHKITLARPASEKRQPAAKDDSRLAIFRGNLDKAFQVEGGIGAFAVKIGVYPATMTRWTTTTGSIKRKRRILNYKTSRLLLQYFGFHGYDDLFTKEWQPGKSPVTNENLPALPIKAISKLAGGESQLRKLLEFMENNKKILDAIHSAGGASNLLRELDNTKLKSIEDQIRELEQMKKKLIGR